MFRPRPLRFLGVCALALAAGCAASGPRSASQSSEPSASPNAKSRQAMSVRYLTYGTGQKLALVNPAHSDRTELYSKTIPLEQAGTKVTTDEVLGATVEELERIGLFRLTRPGAAPESAAGSNPQALEVTRDGATVHVLLTRESSVEDKRVFRDCAYVFRDIYNATYQLQSVQDAPDWEAQKKVQLQGQAKKGG